ncbi:thiopeptide-type bacteriocin biosynthesis protein [Halostreptopolyspora alba]|uniref:Lantibiotic biosynthesis protein n=1 Tax=Halostreptopolyspora alba TaxID=2487137 RepID=A0A3N0E8S2_9ACTN|nr:lantibiotic biosynthesis protein [Nocardiopsaceae bacterium YIM 96095]
MGESGWIATHVYYHGDLDALLTGAVAPLVDELDRDRAIEDWFFVRYWEGGPHVRLRVRTSRNADPERVHHLVNERLRAWTAAHPAPDTNVGHEYARTAKRRAALENRTSYETGVRPNNAVEPRPYEREYAAYGSDEVLSAVERHFAESSWLALRILATGPSRDRRSQAALAMLVVALAVAEPDLRRLAALLPGGPGGESPVRAGEPELVLPAAVRERVAHLWDAGARTRGGETSADRGALAAWLVSVRGLCDRLARPEAATGLSVARPVSPLISAPPEDGTGRTVPLLLRCTHMMNNRLGLFDQEERHIAATAVRALADLARRRGGEE